MIELEVPESVADFIEGRVAKKIGSKHYVALARQSCKFTQGMLITLDVTVHFFFNFLSYECTRVSYYPPYVKF